MESPEAFASKVAFPAVSTEFQEKINLYVSDTTATIDQIIAKNDLLEEYKASALETVRLKALAIDDIEKSQYYSKIRCEALATVEAGGEQHKGTWSVYVLTKTKDDHTVIYVGMTNNPERRQSEHRRTKTDYPELKLWVVKTGFTDKNTARVTEMTYMTAFFPEIYEAKQNKIRSISVKK